MKSLKPKLIKTEQAEFVAGVWDGKNGCGYAPLDDAVLILPDKAAEKTTGGIIMTNGFFFTSILGEKSPDFSHAEYTVSSYFFASYAFSSSILIVCHSSLL